MKFSARQKTCIIVALLFGVMMPHSPAFALEAGTWNNRTYMFADNTRGQADCALVIAFHGKTATSGFMAAVTHLHHAPDCMVVVYPQGKARLPDASCWNAHRYDLPRNGCEGKYGGPATRDREFIVQLINELSSTFETAITVLVGSSNGGRIAADIGCHHPNLVDMVALVSSRSISEDCVSPVAPVRFLSLIGGLDPDPGITIELAEEDAAIWNENVVSPVTTIECPNQAHSWASGTCGSTGIVLGEARQIPGWVPGP